jgi:hypothetical protein
VAEPASVAEPADIPPPSGQRPTSQLDDQSIDDEELPTVSVISRRASGNQPRSLSISLTESEASGYYINWLVYMGKELLYSDLITSEE